MISLTKQVESLERVLAKLQQRCNILEARACEIRLADPVQRKTNEKRLEKMHEQMRQAEQEMSAIAEALSLLYDYAE